MNREDIILMAREAEFHVSGQRVLSPVIEGSDLLWLLERFATLVRADEREACAKVAEQVLVGNIRDNDRIAAAIRARGNT